MSDTQKNDEPDADNSREHEGPICILTGGHVRTGVHRTKLEDGSVRVDARCARCGQEFSHTQRPGRR